MVICLYSHLPLCCKILLSWFLLVSSDTSCIFLDSFILYFKALGSQNYLLWVSSFWQKIFSIFFLLFSIFPLKNLYRKMMLPFYEKLFMETSIEKVSARLFRRLYCFEIKLLQNSLCLSLSACLCLYVSVCMSLCLCLLSSLMFLMVQLVMHFDCPDLYRVLWPWISSFLSVLGSLGSQIWTRANLSLNWESQTLTVGVSWGKPPPSLVRFVQSQNFSCLLLWVSFWASLKCILFLNFTGSYSSSLFIVVCGYRCSGCIEHDGYMKL